MTPVEAQENGLQFADPKVAPMAHPLQPSAKVVPNAQEKVKSSVGDPVQVLRVIVPRHAETPSQVIVVEVDPPRQEHPPPSVSVTNSVVGRGFAQQATVTVPPPDPEPLPDPLCDPD
jgi:hypothetical protein